MNIILKNISKLHIIEEAEKNNDFYIMTLKDYKDTSISFLKNGKKTIITVNFITEETSFDWKSSIIDSFSDNPLAEEILKPIHSYEEEAKVKKAIKAFTEKINKEYKGPIPQHHDYFASVEEMKSDLSGIENVEIIAKYDPDNPITTNNVEFWRLHNIDEDY